MDTKYQNKFIPITVFLLSVFLFGVALMSCFEKKLDYDEDSVSYFHNVPEISERAVRMCKNLQRYYIYFANFNLKDATFKLEEIDSYLKLLEKYGVENFNDYNQGPIPDIDADSVAPESFYSIDVTKYPPAYLRKIKLELSELVTNYRTIEEYLSVNNDFHFFVKDLNKNKILGSNSEDFQDEKSYEKIDETDTIFDISFNGRILSEYFTDANVNCIISIPYTVSPDIKYYIDSVKTSIAYNKAFSSGALTFCLVFAGTLLLILLWIFKHRQLMAINKQLYNSFAVLPLFVKVPVMVFLGAFVIQQYLYRGPIITDYFRTQQNLILVIYFFVCSVVVLYTFLFLEHIFKIIKKPILIFEEKEFEYIETFFEDLKIVKTLKRPFITFILIALTICLVINVIAMYAVLLGVNLLFRTLLVYSVMLINLVILGVMYNFLESEIKLRYYINGLAEKRIDSIPYQKGLFSSTINKVNTINENITSAMNEKLKSERMKTDLITNVSHDLKTPLTSIISYVDILKHMNIENEQEREYIDIIKTKATRLKILIDDLFEASKLSSGQLTLEKRESNIVSLIEQTMGELEERIEKSNIDFVMKLPKTPVILNIDGQKMWRVFDNLINNIIKYSPSDSRAYITMEENENSVNIIFKNVANYAMDFDNEELFERFKRGDRARSTEGSGLGLSIAKNIVELHDGSMDITTDGDLFKISVTLPKQNV
ncbi:MAG: HAMP domain-containing histidine kinase [Firmicutes bacterium]|nr:HAMP domain-containing histidine kinase [Bacillota bacterium]